MQTIENAYIAVELQDQSLAGFRQTLQSSLSEAGLSTETPERGAHVSLSYILGETTEEHLNALVRRISSQRIELKVKGVEVLSGETTPFDYVVLALEENDAFRHAREQIESELITKEFAGGFHTHVTLLRLPKAANASEMAAEIRDCLARVAQPYCGCMSVCGERLAVFDSQKCCRIQYRMAAAAKSRS